VSAPDLRDVTACLVTRGDHPEAIDRIIDGLIFDNVIVWDNSVRERDWKCAGRYVAAAEADTPIVYFQDDDVTVPAKTQWTLLGAYEPGVMVANWAHGDDPDGYDDLPLVGAGAIVDTHLCWDALNRYLDHYPPDDWFCYEADFVAGALYPDFRHLRLPFTIEMELATAPSRLCNQPFQRDLKFDVTQRARAIRDGLLVAA